jgi:hypothetical protein
LIPGCLVHTQDVDAANIELQAFIHINVKKAQLFREQSQNSFRCTKFNYITTEVGRPRLRTCPSDLWRRRARGARLACGLLDGAWALEIVKVCRGCSPGTQR